MKIARLFDTNYVNEHVSSAWTCYLKGQHSKCKVKQSWTLFVDWLKLE